MRLIYIILLVIPLVFETVSSADLIKSLTKRQACNSCNTCNTGNCNSVCSGSTTCCTTCNSCINTCSSNCQTQSCQNNCANSCASSCNSCSTPCTNNCGTTTPIDRPTPIFIPPAESQVVERPIILNNTNINLANHTANINIHNAINNTNVIHIPIFVNTTNYNNIDIQQPQPVIPNIPYPPAQTQNGVVEIIKIIERQNITNTETEKTPDNPKQRCCYVLHPRICQVTPNGEKKCFVRRHWECSDICTSSVVVIPGAERIIYPPLPPTIINPPPIINPPVIIRPPPIIRQPPIIIPQQPCAQYPWSYCGNYQTGAPQTQGCEGCYSCGGIYNPQVCSQSTSCSEECRANMITSRCRNVIQTYCD